MVNWNLITENKNESQNLRRFAQGKISGTEFYDLYKNTDKAGVVRSLLRDNGVVNARHLARKALNRRGISVSN